MFGVRLFARFLVLSVLSLPLAVGSQQGFCGRALRFVRAAAVVLPLAVGEGCTSTPQPPEANVAPEKLSIPAEYLGLWSTDLGGQRKVYSLGPTGEFEQVSPGFPIDGAEILMRYARDQGEDQMIFTHSNPQLEGTRVRLSLVDGNLVLTPTAGTPEARSPITYGKYSEMSLEDYRKKQEEITNRLTGEQWTLMAVETKPGVDWSKGRVMYAGEEKPNVGVTSSRRDGLAAAPHQVLRFGDRYGGWFTNATGRVTAGIYIGMDEEGTPSAMMSYSSSYRTDPITNSLYLQSALGDHKGVAPYKYEIERVSKVQLVLRMKFTFVPDVDPAAQKPVAKAFEGTARFIFER